MSGLINPYYIYVFSFLGVLAAYLLGWSNLFPPLGSSLLLFLVCSILVALFIGRSFAKRKIITFNNVEYKDNVNWITYAILIGYGIEILYFRNFPLLAVFSKSTMSYTDFGIPTFHVFLVTFNSFFSIYLFQLILSVKENRKKLIILFVLNLVPSLLILNRGMLIIILMSCVFVYLIKYQSKITIRKIAGLLVLAIIGLYLFGMVGNMRVNKTYQTQTSRFDNSMFLQIGGATKDFKESLIPKEFFWTYIYAASPIANLQETIDKYEMNKDISLTDSFKFTTTQILPDFISKRIVKLYDFTVPNPLQIAPELNVSTAFAQPYVIMGWVGISFFAIFAFMFSFFYILLLKRINSEYFVVGVAILNSIFVFNTFSNMFAFTGLSFQLVYPILFSLFSVKKINPKAVNDENNISNSVI
ncbi:O-antigen polymerase [Neobacillus sp. PS3-12]|uniref:O-antigen polymerase n=1 Tax=Neobacillus sp. PS3-12 TaxID=3070677 RepID=UPI0027DEBDBF|nr:O-antigen polymerase [Neobacillus sp. PS3-12]WML54774.1 O-antigen polymerase [Neobacillus sp. PS3-12]